MVCCEPCQRSESGEKGGLSLKPGERRGRRSCRVDDLPRDEHLPHWHEKDFKVATANHVIRKGLSHMLGDGRLWTTMDEVRPAQPPRSCFSPYVTVADHAAKRTVRAVH